MNSFIDYDVSQSLRYMRDKQTGINICNWYRNEYKVITGDEMDFVRALQDEVDEKDVYIDFLHVYSYDSDNYQRRIVHIYFKNAIDANYFQLVLKDCYEIK